ncbi:MAG: LPS export ABC transporter permease LptF [Pseudomonadota bacterium]
MSKFDRYILSQLTVTFGLFALILVSVYWVNRAVSLFDRLIADGQTAWVFLVFTALTLPNVILLVLPVAGFVTTLFVANRLIAESEMLIAQSTGLSAARLVRPALLFGIGLALVMALLAHFLVPLSRTELAKRQQEVSRDIAARFLSAGRFLHPSDGVTLYIREITEHGELLDIFLADRRERGHSVLYLAQKALIVRSGDGTRLVMFDGMSQTLREDDQRLSILEFEDLTYDLDGLIPQREMAPPDIRALSTAALLRASAEDQRRTGRNRAQFLAAAHARLAQPLQAPVLVLIGAAALLLGGFNRLGVTRQILLAVLLIIVFQLLNNMALDMARRSEVGWPLLYIPALYGILAGLTLVWLADRPALFRGRARLGS